MNTRYEKNSGMFGRTMTPVLVGAALLLAGSVASAQRVIDLDAPTAPTAPTPPHAPMVTGHGSFHGTYTVVNDGDEVKVESDGKTAVVSLNGSQIATLDLGEDWTRYEVQNSKGDVVATLLRPGKGSPLLRVFSGEAPEDAQFFDEEAPLGTETWTFNLHALDELRSLERAQVFGVAPRAEHPKVMIGVYLESIDEDSAVEAGLDPEAVTEISGVVEGGPAEKAGLAAGDVITSVGGSATGDLATIRAALKEMEPGDTLSLTVRRDGQEKAINVALEAYNAQVFNKLMTPRVPSPPLTPDQIAERQAKMSELAAKLAELSAELGQTTGAQAEHIRQQITELSAKIEQLSAQIAQNAILRFGDPGGLWVDIQKEGEEGKRKVILMPQGIGEHEPLQIRLDALERRIDESLADMDRRLDEMNRRIDRKLNELVDELLRRMKEQADNPR